MIRKKKEGAVGEKEEKESGNRDTDGARVSRRAYTASGGGRSKIPTWRARASTWGARERASESERERERVAVAAGIPSGGGRAAAAGGAGERLR